MSSTRSEILAYFETNRQASAADLSRTMNLTIANIRHHLDILLEEGAIEIAGKTAPQGRGRPTLIYMPARRAADPDTHPLLSALLEEIETSRTALQRENRLKKLAARLVGAIQRKKTAIPQNFNHAVQRLEELGYHSRWEARAQGPQIILGRCPYAAVIDQHPILCSLDKHLLETMLEKKVEQREKITYRPEGPAQCVFHVK